MVFISKRIRFLLAEHRRAVTEAFQFNPFVDEDVAVANQPVQQIPEFVNEFDTPPQTNEIVELAPARCREAEMQHPRPVRRVTLQAALCQLEEMANQSETPLPQHMQPIGKVEIQGMLTGFEGMVQATTSQPASHNEELFVSNSNQSVLTSDGLVPGKPFEEHVYPFMFKVDNLSLWESLACLSSKLPEHPLEHQRGLPLQQSFILDEIPPEVSPIVCNPITAADPQVTGGAQVAFTPREENLWHGFNPIDSNMGEPDCNWIPQWSTMNRLSSGFEMSQISITDETLQPATLPDYVQDDGHSESSSRNSLIESSWPVLSHLPSQDILMNDAQTVPNQPVNLEDGLMSAATQEGGFDSSAFLWLPMAEDAPGLSFDI